MRIISMLFVLLFISVQSMALGKIAGKVTDEKSGETVIGANVIVKGTPNGTSTDVDGNFTLNVAAGTYTIEVKYIGYQTKEIADVKVTGNATTTLNISMAEASSTTLNEVVIHSTLKKENINALYVIQKNAATISDGISADVIKKSPDRNTGEVLKRVSGTTVQDGKYVVVRGLSDRYNTAMLDNSILPSTEANRKVFSFDIIPSSLIDNIVINKAATPDLPGDFAGGIINILTKEIPDQDFGSISIGGGYNTASTFKTFKTGYKSSTDFLGFDDGARALPTASGFPQDAGAVEDLRTNALITKNNQPTIDVLNQFNNNYSTKERKALPNMNLQASGGKSFTSKNGNKLGVIGGITYGHTEGFNDQFTRQYRNFNVTDKPYKYSSTLGGLFNVGYAFGNNKISLKTLYNRVFDDVYLEREGYDYGKSAPYRLYAYDLTQKSLLKVSLEGDNQVGKGQSKVNWTLGYNKVTNTQPDQRKVSYTMNMSDSTYYADLGTISKTNSRLFSNLDENIYMANAAYSTPFKIGNIKNTVKVGGLVQYRSREFAARFLGFQIDNSVANSSAVLQMPIEQLFSEENINSSAYTLGEVTLPSDKYNATTTTTAGYVMLDDKFTDKLRLVLGARVENYNVILMSTNSALQPVTLDSNWLDILPSANLTYALTDKSNLRASYYKTVARPELREMAPFSYFDFETQTLQNGNPNLRRTQINNADLRYEIYPNPGEVISASVFYKHFKNPLETFVFDAASSLETQIYNFTEAQNIGIEAEIRKDLGFIKALKNFNFYTNLAYIKSTVSDSAVGTSLAGLTKRPLTGQSNYVINAGLGYTAMEGKLNMNLLYNRIGERIALVGGTQFGNTWEMPRNLLDFQASYNLSKRSELRLNIKDILNNKYRFYVDQNKNNKFDGVEVANDGSWSKDMMLSTYRPGTTFSLTYTYKF
jgi:outer membrane receptor protein involved in Fe transport